MYYAGIGSRNTPVVILNMFQELGRSLAEKGYVLRSGRADGADSYFEKGAVSAVGGCEIFLPWKSFQSNSELASYPAIIFDAMDKRQQAAALESVNHYHPNPRALSAGARKLMARNYCQLFGTSPESEPSGFVVCYTSDGLASGGTGQAIRMASDANIPVFNAHGYESHPDDFITLVLSNI